MRWHDTVYLLASSVAPVLAIACVFYFAAAQYEAVWACAFFVVLCMETRVQAGGRLPRTAILWIHLASAVPFFLALSALAFFARFEWLEIAAALLGLAALCTGAVLWYRGLEARMLHLQR